jgi:ABC-type transport system substrate-binding protein
MTDDTGLSRRRFLQATGGAAGAAALAGCLGGDGGDGGNNSGGGNNSNGGNSGGGKVLKDATYRKVSSTISTLDPVASSDAASGAKIQNIFDCLTTYENGTTNVVMELATDYKKKKGGKVIEFSLKKDATFSNGDKVTAQDFVYAWERLAASDNSVRKSFILADLGVKHETKKKKGKKGKTIEVYKQGSLAVKAVDKHTFQMELKKPFFGFLALVAYTSFAAVPEGIVGDIEGYKGKMSYGKFSGKKPIGAGAFTLKRWKNKAEMVLKARDDYHGEGPYVKDIQYQILSKTSAIYNYATKNVNSDHASIPESHYKPSKITWEGTDDLGRKYGTYGPLTNGLTAQYYEVEELFTDYYAFNTNRVKKPIRQAVAYLFNQKQLTEQVWTGPGRPAYFFTPPPIFPNGQDNYKKMAKEWPYGKTSKIDKAKKIMEKQGYSKNNKKKMSFVTPTGKLYKKSFKILRDKAAAAHIKLTLSQAPWSTFLNRTEKGNFDMEYLGWIADFPSPSNFLKLLWPPATQIGSDIQQAPFDWDDTPAAKRAKKAWEKYQSHTDPTKKAQKARNEAFLEIEKANWEDAVMLPLHHGVEYHSPYQWVEKPRAGAMGSGRQKENTTKIHQRPKQYR